MPDGSRELIERAAIARREGRLPDAQRDFAEADALLEESQGGNDRARAMWREAKALYASVGVAAGVKECEEHLERLGGDL